MNQKKITMKKLFTLLTSLAIISSGASEVIACSEKFDKWNLSTWGDKQKQIIVNSYLKSAKNWYIPDTNITIWSNWCFNSTGPERYAINTAFDLVNGAFNANSIYITYDYQPLPSGDSDLKQDLANGINLIMKALVNKYQPFKGELTMTIKGSI